MRENVDQNNSEYGHFLRSEFHIFTSKILDLFTRKVCIFLKVGYFLTFHVVSVCL